MVAMATSIEIKIYTCPKKWISGYYFMMLWKGYQNFDFTQNLEDLSGMIH